MYNEYTLADAAMKYYSTGADKTQRFGQFFVNTYMPPDTIWPELFYEENNLKVITMIVNHIEGKKNVVYAPTTEE